MDVLETREISLRFCTGVVFCARGCSYRIPCINSSFKVWLHVHEMRALNGVNDYSVIASIVCVHGVFHILMFHDEISLTAVCKKKKKKGSDDLEDNLTLYLTFYLVSSCLWSYRAQIINIDLSLALFKKKKGKDISACRLVCV